jgi:hypothetical protein
LENLSLFEASLSETSYTFAPSGPSPSRANSEIMMTRRTNATIVGIAYLVYIAAAYPRGLLFNRATSGDGMAAKLVWLIVKGVATPEPEAR